MKITVDRSLCDDHGQCTIAAPAVFTLGDDGLQFDSEPDDSLRRDVEDAADVCPMQAILLES
ncbi:ferredoxin [Mycobacterium sp. MS1601]|uniref:ferredoxin n=1 Tax=Mycobacterium sp. MS1601 TaxID=1936029 RepID=UPI00097966C2|nr:ferredoxin [Mycobacterium sp. MS1601]AQA03344.1 ferredoxin [Mycobacterium sp. MS1601]